MNRKFLGILIAALLPGAAMSLPIVATPTDTVGPLRHNVFHDASSAGGQNGAVLAWFDLDTSTTSTWDPTTGALSLYINVFTDSSLTTLVGTGFGSSTTLAGGGFGDFDNSSLGFITWTFDPGAAALLGTSGLTMEFLDRTYPGDSSGNIPNTYVGNTLTLWGADGTPDGNQFVGSTLGVDLVIVVPEPAVIGLLALGLLGLAIAVSRRRH